MPTSSPLLQVRRFSLDGKAFVCKNFCHFLHGRYFVVKCDRGCVGVVVRFDSGDAFDIFQGRPYPGRCARSHASWDLEDNHPFRRKASLIDKSECKERG